MNDGSGGGTRVMIELWGGAECTVSRVGDAFRDQTRESGHQDRLADLELFAQLGLAAIRYPVLWERVAPDDPEVRDWRWSDERLERVRALGMRPIVGLIHHGSGPRYTNLLADDFAAGLARHAAAVAARYPWVEAWTPVNEPVTTARFSALYGHWYPHRRDERSFWLALLNQIDGVRLSMRAIRAVNPAARLVQTEDLGRTYATVALRDQAAFDNCRRWMSWDLLCGRVTPDHPFWPRLRRLGLAGRLRAIADDPCPPDLIGINHYLTSDRFLDHRVERYGQGPSGGNGRQRFADVEAVRVLQPPSPGLAGALGEAWSRYRIPIAITEVHNGCTREEQMRWMADAWRSAEAAGAEGIDIRAVTSWALLGSHGWDTLLTAPGRYEAGAFDVSGGQPRPTALAGLLRTLASGGDPLDHPVLRGDGWWRRSIRLAHPVVARPAPMREHLRRPPDGTERPILIAGATGTLGGALAAACRHRRLAFVLTDRAAMDLSHPDSIAAALDRHRPWAVINAAGWVRVDDAESDADACMAANATGAIALARACDEAGIPSVAVSSDLVFGDGADRPLVESDPVAPLGVYGRSKAEAERAIAGLPGRHLIVRTAAFFSPFDRHNFAVHAVDALAAGRPFAAADDQVVTPSYVPDLCDAMLDLVIDGEMGRWHLSSGEALSWADFARRIAVATGLDEGLVRPAPGATLGWVAPRPSYAALGSERGRPMPPLERALARFAAEIARAGRLGGARAA